MRRFLLLLLVLVVGGACAPEVQQDVSLSANLEERRMGFDALCQHLKFEAIDRIVYPGQQPPAGHLHDHYGTLAEPDASVTQMQQSSSACNRPEDTAGYWVTAVMKPAHRAAEHDRTLQAERTDESHDYAGVSSGRQQVLLLPPAIRRHRAAMVRKVERDHATAT